jgi:hypothetical protein
MKYIKTFEKKTLMYDVGDYVYVVGYPDINNFCQIYKINKYISKGEWDYMINFFDEDGYNSSSLGMYIDENDITRNLTNDEILEYKTKIDAAKFNL